MKLDAKITEILPSNVKQQLFKRHSGFTEEAQSTSLVRAHQSREREKLGRKEHLACVEALSARFVKSSMVE